MQMRASKACFGGMVALCLSVAAAAAEPTFIAGTTPWKRPDAPVVTEVVKPEGWYQRALTGIEAPFPASLRFLEDQGNWFTPFIHPGMLAPYDIRNWHQGD